MRARGLSQIEIAHELQVSKQLISVDMQYLRNEAKKSIKEYTTGFLPEQYRVCLAALDTILKHAYEILQEAHDNREKIQAMELFKDTHMTKLELLSNATTIDSALEYIRSKQSQHQQQKDEQHTGLVYTRNKQQQQKGLALDSANEDDNYRPESTGRQTVF